MKTNTLKDGITENNYCRILLKYKLDKGLSFKRLSSQINFMTGEHISSSWLKLIIIYGKKPSKIKRLAIADGTGIPYFILWGEEK